jgi:hypothetical protein
MHHDERPAKAGLFITDHLAAEQMIEAVDKFLSRWPGDEAFILPNDEAPPAQRSSSGSLPSLRGVANGEACL